MRRITVCGILLAGAGWLDGQVVLSRRVYAEHGRTWRQLWIAEPGKLDFQQLTRSGRDHSQPLCSRDGKTIYFTSDRDGARSVNAYFGAHGRELWAFDRETGQERLVWQTSGDGSLELNGTTADGGVLVRVGTELRSLLREPWRIEKMDPAYNSAAVSPDGRTLAVVIAGSLDKEGQSHDAKLFFVGTATDRSRVEVGKYEAPTWSPDGKQIAAFGENGLAIVDVATRKEVARVSLPKHDGPPEDLVWSPDQKFVLAGLYGEEGGSGDPQLDYFLLNLTDRTWTPAVTGENAIWLRGGTILLYLRPVQTTPLAPGSPHSVWTTPLAVFDLATRKDTELSTGLVQNDYLAVCP